MNISKLLIVALLLSVQYCAARIVFGIRDDSTNTLIKFDHTQPSQILSRYASLCIIVIYKISMWTTIIQYRHFIVVNIFFTALRFLDSIQERLLLVLIFALPMARSTLLLLTQLPVFSTLSLVLHLQVKP